MKKRGGQTARTNVYGAPAQSAGLNDAPHIYFFNWTQNVVKSTTFISYLNCILLRTPIKVVILIKISPYKNNFSCKNLFTLSLHIFQFTYLKIFNSHKVLMSINNSSPIGLYEDTDTQISSVLCHV